MSRRRGGRIEITEERACDVIRAPVITEKSTMASEHNQVTFRVAKDASKPEIRAAVEQLFKVKVKSVNTIRQKGKVKLHETPPHGTVARLFEYEGYGFIQSADGREIYFHRNSVLNSDFDKLEIGAQVRFEEAVGEKGPQATTVNPVPMIP